VRNPVEPQSAPLDPAAEPPALAENAVALEEWRRLAPGLTAAGQVTVADRSTLLAYCLLYADWLELRELVRTPVVTGAMGKAVSNPLLRLQHQTLALLLKAAAELGITPSSRARVHAVAATPPVSKWAGALK
jgi:P27 family predicted phage terminase small subunit